MNSETKFEIQRHTANGWCHVTTLDSKPAATDWLTRNAQPTERYRIRQVETAIQTIPWERLKG